MEVAVGMNIIARLEKMMAVRHAINKMKVTKIITAQHATMNMGGDEKFAVLDVSF
jgi:hypothetical protein